MGAVSGKLVINRPTEKAKDDTETRPAEETNGGPVQENTAEVVKGNADLDVPLIDDVTEVPVKLEQPVVQPNETMNNDQSEENRQAAVDEPNGDLTKVTDQSYDDTCNKNGRVSKKLKNPFAWIQRRVSRKSQAKRQKKQQQSPEEQQDNEIVNHDEEATAAEAVTSADNKAENDAAEKETNDLVEEIMTSATVVTHTDVEDALTSPVNGSASLIINAVCPSEVTVVQDTPQISIITEHEQPVIAATVEPTDHENSSEKRHVQLVNVSPAVIGEMHQAAVNQSSHVECETPLEHSHGEVANGGDHFGSYIGMDTETAKLNGDGLVNGTYNDDEPEDVVIDVPSDTAMAAKLASLDMSNGPSESTLPTDHKQELRCEPVT